MRCEIGFKVAGGGAVCPQHAIPTSPSAIKTSAKKMYRAGGGRVNRLPKTRWIHCSYGCFSSPWPQKAPNYALNSLLNYMHFPFLEKASIPLGLIGILQSRNRLPKTLWIHCSNGCFSAPWTQKAPNDAWNSLLNWTHSTGCVLGTREITASVLGSWDTPTCVLESRDPAPKQSIMLWIHC